MSTKVSDRAGWSRIRLPLVVAIVVWLAQVLAAPTASGDPKPWFYGAQRLGSWSELEPLVPGPALDFPTGSSSINLSDARNFHETWVVPRYWGGRAVVVNIYKDLMPNGSGRTIEQELLSRGTVTDDTVRKIMHDIYATKYPRGSTFGQIHESTMTKDGWLFITDGQPVSGPRRSGKAFRGAHVGPNNAGGSTQIARLINAKKAAGGCFVAGTPIIMADGREESIERVTVGSFVLAFDEKAHRVVPARVTKTFVHENDGPTTIVNARIRSTAEHPYYVEGRWVGASELTTGDDLLAVAVKGDGEELTTEAVSSVVLSSGGQLVYNFEVDTFHDYFAGRVLVHNQSWQGQLRSAASAGRAAAEEAPAAAGGTRGGAALAEEAAGAGAGTGERAFRWLGRGATAWGVYQTGSHLAAGENREAAESAIGLHPELGLMLGAEQVTAFAIGSAYERIYPKKTEAERERDQVIISDEQQAALFGMGPENARKVLAMRAAAEERKRLENIEKEKYLDTHVRGKARWVGPLSNRAKWWTFVNPLTGNRWF